MDSLQLFVMNLSILNMEKLQQHFTTISLILVSLCNALWILVTWSSDFCSALFETVHEDHNNKDDVFHADVSMTDATDTSTKSSNSTAVSESSKRHEGEEDIARPATLNLAPAKAYDDAHSVKAQLTGSESTSLSYRCADLQDADAHLVVKEEAHFEPEERQRPIRDSTEYEEASPEEKKARQSKLITEIPSNAATPTSGEVEQLESQFEKTSITPPCTPSPATSPSRSPILTSTPSWCSEPLFTNSNLQQTTALPSPPTTPTAPIWKRTSPTLTLITPTNVFPPTPPLTPTLPEPYPPPSVLCKRKRSSHDEDCPVPSKRLDAKPPSVFSWTVSISNFLPNPLPVIYKCQALRELQATREEREFAILWRKFEKFRLEGDVTETKCEDNVEEVIAEKLRRLSLEHELPEEVVEGVRKLSLEDVDGEPMVWTAHPRMLKRSWSWPLCRSKRLELDGSMDVC